jgi:hypothetical protein
VKEPEECVEREAVVGVEPTATSPEAQRLKCSSASVMPNAATGSPRVRERNTKRSQERALGNKYLFFSFLLSRSLLLPYPLSFSLYTSL